MEYILNFIVNDVFGNASIFIGLIAVVGLMIQRKKFSEVLSGGVKTALGQLILSQGTSIISASIAGLSTAYLALNPTSVTGEITEIGADGISNMFGMQIGVVMLIAFAVNILVAKFTRWKTIFLTGHMLYWFPFMFIAVGYGAGLSGTTLVVFSAIFTAIYMIVTPNLLQPFVRAVTGDNSFAIGHPTNVVSLIAGFLAKIFGNKNKSTEDINVPKSLDFLKDIGIASALIIFVTYLVFAGIMAVCGVNFVEVFGINSELSVITFALVQGFTFGAGITVMMLGVRMMIAEIVPAFKGISEKIVPDAIPALDCAVLFPYAPNAMVIGFITSLITSTITLVIVSAIGCFDTVILPLVVTCCFEVGCAGVIANAQGGLRGTVIGTAVAGVFMILMIGVGAPFFMSTINQWILVYGGQDFSVWGIISGLIANLIA